MANNTNFRKIMLLPPGGIEYQWVTDLLKPEEKENVDQICQHIVDINLYNPFCDSHDSNFGKGQFNLCMINEMQKGNKSIFEYIFKDYMQNVYDNTIKNMIFRWLIIN